MALYFLAWLALIFIVLFGYGDLVHSLEERFKEKLPRWMLSSLDSILCLFVMNTPAYVLAVAGGVTIRSALCIHLGC
ncbi:MAG: hypothetical protein N2C14_33030, partial [Planctomycetales bacterium]